MTINVNIPEKYSEITAGEKVYFETEVKWPENTERKDLRLEYSITNSKDEEVAYLKVLKAIETQASFMDSISIPEGTLSGLHKIHLKITDYAGLEQEVAASFQITKESNGILNYLMIIVGLLILVVIIVTIEMFYLLHKQKLH